MKNNSKYAHLTKDEAINEILIDSGLSNVIRAPEEYVNGKIRKAMEEAFREGFLRGEEFAYGYYKPDKNRVVLTKEHLDIIEQVTKDNIEEL